MSDEEKAFIASCEANPVDEAPRLVFADWLDEHDRPEDAQRQRQWVAAYRFLMPFVRGGEHDYDEKTYKPIPPKDVPFKEMMKSINYWAESIKRKGLDRYGDTICFDSKYAQDELWDKTKRAEFWRCMEIITGLSASDELRNQEGYSCAC